ncbi:hypothetical protein L3X38_026108 [Prunus dulcis]|uniref:Uncharacterized protein n=1 Tax=Prunus dulcis TaxID=3755 RepID=A0AAD4W4K2_PRUDU|nr:hypothetical protein L3X38_026108 [Prunus dulcis]
MLFCATDVVVRRAKSNKSAETTRVSFFPISGFPPPFRISLRRRLRLRPLSPFGPQPPPCRHLGRLPAVGASLPSRVVGFSRFFAPDFSLLRPPFSTSEMSDLIRRGRSMTTAPSSDPPAQSASAATAPALLDNVVVGREAFQAPASSASSVTQPASARRRHRPTDTMDATSTDGTGASGSQPGITTLLYCYFYIEI